MTGPPKGATAKSALASNASFRGIMDKEVIDRAAKAIERANQLRAQTIETRKKIQESRERMLRLHDKLLLATRRVAKS